MYRTIEQHLLKWKNSKFRMPLIIRGARQVGKSYVVDKFAKQYLDFIAINFEQNKIAPQFFTTLEPNEIIAKIELYFGKRVIPDNTLLFFDEIQACPDALQALRYFKEQRSDIHIITAGSLLEFYLNTAEVSFPVGRVSFLYLGPLSFHEYLLAAEENLLLEALQQATFAKPPSDIVHLKAAKLFQEYTMLGGMPAVVERYFATKSFFEAFDAQKIILDGYIHDFLKYKKHVNVALLTKVFQHAPRLVAQHFKYNLIDPELRSRDIKSALQQLCWTGIISQIYASHANGIPLKSEIRDNRFKLLMLDVGLLQNSLGVNYQEILQTGVLQVNAGVLAEQIAGQELKAIKNPAEPELFFWEKETKGATAQVEYVITLNGKVVPIEVKAGKTGRRFSLRKFMEEKNVPLGILISAKPLGKDSQILQVPFYMIQQLERLHKESQ